jgi:regulator of protease activity HflC (stomatin/prohibitin superfamily)
MNIALGIVAVLVIVAVLLLATAVRVLREYERGVVFRLGRLLPGPKGPGLILLIPFGIDKMVKTELRTITLAIPPQEVISKDNVPVRVTAVTYFRVVDPQAAVTQIENYMVATSQIAQTTLRSVLGQHSLDELLAERDKINEILQDIIDKHTAPWGIKISVVEVKDVELPTTMQRAMARQAEAERERRAKIIGAQGEYEAAEQLSLAADRIAASPIALQLRYLQTLLEISSGNNATTILPFPIDILRPLQEAIKAIPVPPAPPAAG